MATKSYSTALQVLELELLLLLPLQPLLLQLALEVKSTVKLV